MFSKNLFGLEKNGDVKVWNIRVEDNSIVAGDHQVEVFITIEHGKQNGKLTTKIENILEGKQGRNLHEQGVSEAQSRVNKQLKRGYRESVEELTDLPIMAMLAKDHTKAGKNQEEKIEEGVFTSDKLDGIRLLAFCKLINGVKTVELKSRMGEEIILPHIAQQLLEIMEVGEIYDGEAYVHGPALQDINSAVQRTDTQVKIDEAHRKVKRLEDKFINGEKYDKALAEFDNAVLIHELRPKLEFHVFDVVQIDIPFTERLDYLNRIAKRFHQTPHVKKVAYKFAKSIVELTEQLHDCISRGYEGIMYRFKDGLYESGKRSAFLWKFKLFFDEEFEIVGSHKDKQGGIIFELKNNLNHEQFDCVMGDYAWRLAVADDDFSGQYMTVKFQARNKGTLIPQFGTGKDIRKGVIIDGKFTPTM